MAIVYAILGFIFLILPLILTLLNILNLFKKKKIKENLIDILIFLLGIPLTILLYYISDFKDYPEALRLGGGELGLHSPIASWSFPTVFSILILGIISYGLIRIKKLKLPPFWKQVIGLYLQKYLHHQLPMTDIICVQYL